MLYLVLFPDGRLKAFKDLDLAKNCARADGGELIATDPAPAPITPATPADPEVTP